ncbi:MAG: DUF6714 family protein [Chthoniobacteraceae bacterium]
MPKKPKAEECVAPKTALDLTADYVLRAIDEAFPIRPIASGLLISHQCVECIRLHDDFAGRRRPDVPLSVISYHADSLPLFTPAAHRYYLPAFFRVALSRKLPSDHILLDMVIYDLCPDGSACWQQRFGLFTASQLGAAARWLEFVLSHEYDFWPDMRVVRSGYERYCNA